MPSDLPQPLGKWLPLNKQFAFLGSVTSDSHGNGAALGSSTAAPVHQRPVRNHPYSTNLAQGPIKGPWTEHSLVTKPLAAWLLCVEKTSLTTSCQDRCRQPRGGWSVGIPSFFRCISNNEVTAPILLQIFRPLAHFPHTHPSDATKLEEKNTTWRAHLT